MKLKSTIGFEMTGILKDAVFDRSKDLNSRSHHINHALSILVVNKLLDYYPKAFNFANQSFTDGHCCEVPSPVFKTTAAAMRFYRRATKIMQKHGFLPQHPDVVCGGNHIHFGVKFPQNTLMVRSIFRDMYNRPYITWVFTQADDTDSCNNLCTCKEIQEAINNIRNETKIYYSKSANHIAKVLITDVLLDFTGGNLNPDHLLNKSYCVGINHFKKHTLEYRCVEAPLNESEFKDQLDFFIAYTEMHRKRNWVPQIDSGLHKNIQKLTADWAISEFNSLLKRLGLNPNRYKKYVERNLLPRWENKRVRT